MTARKSSCIFLPMIDIPRHATAVETLRQAMLRRGLSVNDVARMTGRPKEYVRAALSGRLAKRSKIDAIIERITMEDT